MNTAFAEYATVIHEILKEKVLIFNLNNIYSLIISCLLTHMWNYKLLLCGKVNNDNEPKINIIVKQFLFK